MSPANKGGNIPPNEADVNLDEETKISKEYQDLVDKKGRTSIEDAQMMALAKKLKEVRSANANKK
jgi:hypothetical protein